MMSKFSIFSLLCLVMSLQAQASNLVPGFDLAKWNATVERAIQTGVVLDMADGTEFRSLERITPADQTRSHVSQYFSPVGYAYSASQYSPSSVWVNAEIWQLDSATSTFQVDQWKCNFDLDGNLVAVEHDLLTEKTDSEVLGYKDYPTQVDGADELRTCGVQMQTWF